MHEAEARGAESRHFSDRHRDGRMRLQQVMRSRPRQMSECRCFSLLVDEILIKRHHEVHTMYQILSL